MDSKHRTSPFCWLFWVTESECASLRGLCTEGLVSSLWCCWRLLWDRYEAELSRRTLSHWLGGPSSVFRFPAARDEHLLLLNTPITIPWEPGPWTVTSENINQTKALLLTRCFTLTDNGPTNCNLLKTYLANKSKRRFLFDISWAEKIPF